jgi:Flp pilus assembly pilin Flp
MEYALIAGSIALIIAGSIVGLGDNLLPLYQDIASMLSNSL